MKPSKIFSGILVTLLAVLPGYGVLAFLLWLYPKQIAPGSGAVPLRAVHFGSITLDRSGMLIALILFSIATLSLIAYGLSIIFSRSLTMRSDPNHFSRPGMTMTKVSLAFALGGTIAVAPLVVFFFFNDVFKHLTSLLPLRVQLYTLFLPMPVFFIGGAIGGMSTRSGIRGVLAFGVAFLLPGFYIPTAYVGTQGARSDYDLIWLTVILPSVCYCCAGAFGAWFLRCGIKGVVKVAAGFALGGFLGPAIGWLTDELLAAHLGHLARIAAACLGLVSPWCFGGLAVAAVLATAHAPPRRDTATPQEGDAENSPSAPSS